MHRFSPIVWHTVRQVIRQRLFLNLAIFGLGMLLLAYTVSFITYGYMDRVIRSIGLSGVAIAIDLMALLLSISLIYTDIDKRTAFVIFTRPIRRWQYVVARYVGLVVVLAMALVGASLLFFIALTLGMGSFSVQDWVALGAVLPEAAVLAAFGTLLSSFTTPTLGAGLGLGFWIISATTDDLVNLSAKAEGPARVMAQAVYYALPSLARFDFREAAVYQVPIPPIDVLMSLAYAGLYVAGLVALASYVLTRREML